MTNLTSVGISHLAYSLTCARASVTELEQDNRLISPAALLRDFGFESCYFSEQGADFTGLVIETGKRVLGQSGARPDDIDTLFLYSGLDIPPQPEGSFVEGELSLFRYPVARAHHELDMGQAPALAVSQRGCSGLLSMVNMASRLLQTSDKDSVLLLVGDALPSHSKREIMYNLMSDAAGALLVKRDSPKNRLVAFHEQMHSYYWDTPLHEQELLAAYFPMSQRVIAGCLERAGLSIEDVRWFVPHNVSLRSWRILARLLNIPDEKVWTENIARVGHTVSCDHIINLVDMEAVGALSPGDYLVLFTFGFGASWSCLVLQH